MPGIPEYTHTENEMNKRTMASRQECAIESDTHKDDTPLSLKVFSLGNRIYLAKRNPAKNVMRFLLYAFFVHLQSYDVHLGSVCIVVVVAFVVSKSGNVLLLSRQLLHVMCANELLLIVAAEICVCCCFKRHSFEGHTIIISICVMCTTCALAHYGVILLKEKSLAA